MASPGVRGRRRQDVDDVGTRVAHLRKAGEHARDREAFGQRVRTIDGGVGDPDDANVRKCLQGADVIGADVPGADQRDSQSLAMCS